MNTAAGFGRPHRTRTRFAGPARVLLAGACCLLWGTGAGARDDLRALDVAAWYRRMEADAAMGGCVARMTRERIAALEAALPEYVREDLAQTPSPPGFLPGPLPVALAPGRHALATAYHEPVAGPAPDRQSQGLYSLMVE